MLSYNSTRPMAMTIFWNHCIHCILYTHTYTHYYTYYLTSIWKRKLKDTLWDNVWTQQEWEGILGLFYLGDINFSGQDVLSKQHLLNRQKSIYVWGLMSVLVFLFIVKSFLWQRYYFYTLLSTWGFNNTVLFMSKLMVLRVNILALKELGYWY